MMMGEAVDGLKPGDEFRVAEPWKLSDEALCKIGWQVQAAEEQAKGNSDNADLARWFADGRPE